MKLDLSEDIAVFTFARGSQVCPNRMNTESYRFVLSTINNMMSKNGVDTPKVGFGGTKEDVICFIAGLIEYQIKYKTNLEYFEVDTKDFDPDMNNEV